MRRIALALVVILIATVACSSSGSLSSRKERLRQCLHIPRIVLKPDHTITEVQGWIENKCTEDIKVIKIVVNGSEYPGGPILGSDEEYIEDLSVGDKKYFEALISDPNREIKAARVEIDEVYLP